MNKKVSGNKPLCLLCVEKEDFFLIQGSKSTHDKLKFLKSSVPLLNHVNYPFEAIEAENKRKVQVCFSRYYRNGVVICADSQHDEWIYIIKSGSCKLLKRIEVGLDTIETFWNEYKVGNRRCEHLKRTECLLNMDKRSNSLLPDIIQHWPKLGAEKDGLTEAFLELPELNEGDVFALNDVIFDRDLDDYKCSLTLVSKGVECILISRRIFLKHLTPQAWFKLRASSLLYSNDQYFINKYFNSFIWKDYKKKRIRKVLNSKTIKTKD